METVKLVLYKVIGNGEFISNTFLAKDEAENVAFITKGTVVEITK